MSKVSKNYNELAGALRFRFDAKHNVIYGSRGGYEILLYPAEANKPYLLTASISARTSTGSILTKEECKQFSKENNTVFSLQQSDYMILMVIKGYSNQEKLRAAVDSALNSLIEFLHARGYAPCCQLCGQALDTANYSTGSIFLQLCPDCASKLRQDMTLAAQEKQQKKENVLGGIVGALIGSIIGVIFIIIFSRLGWIAAASGVVMAICTLKGYEMLGGKLSTKGIIISCIMMILMTYIGDRIDWAIAIVQEVGQEWGLDFFTAFQLIPTMLEEEIIDSSTYTGNLILLYIFTVIGAVPTIRSAFKNQKTEAKLEQVGENNL